MVKYFGFHKVVIAHDEGTRYNAIVTEEVTGIVVYDGKVFDAKTLDEAADGVARWLGLID